MIIHVHAPRNQYSEFGSFEGNIETIFFFFLITDRIALFAGTRVLAIYKF